MLLRVDDHLELDLHRVFVEGALGLTVELDDLFAPPYRFPLGGYELEALPMPQRLLHACYAAALRRLAPRLVSLRDVVQLVLREQPNLVDVLLMAHAWRCEVVVASAISTAWRELAIEPASAHRGVGETISPTRHEPMAALHARGTCARVHTARRRGDGAAGTRDRLAYRARSRSRRRPT